MGAWAMTKRNLFSSTAVRSPLPPQETGKARAWAGIKELQRVYRTPGPGEFRCINGIFTFGPDSIGAKVSMQYHNDT